MGSGIGPERAQKRVLSGVGSFGPSGVESGYPGV
jgi:hypothetical protein